MVKSLPLLLLPLPFATLTAALPRPVEPAAPPPLTRSATGTLVAVGGPSLTQAVVPGTPNLRVLPAAAPGAPPRPRMDVPPGAAKGEGEAPRRAEPPAESPARARDPQDLQDLSTGDLPLMRAESSRQTTPVSQPAFSAACTHGCH